MNTDQEGGDRHCRHPVDERRTPADAIADVADDHAANGPRQIPQGDDAESGQELRDRVLLRKEMMTDCGDEIAVDRKVVSFEYVADQARGDHAPPH